MITIIRIAFLFLSISSLLVAEESKQSFTIGLIGDSTVATTYGWGPAFAKQFNERAKVLNYAKNGATLDALSKKLDELLKRKPDFVLIQFGHNDMKRYDTKAYSTKLKDYVVRIKQAGAKPIVLSSVTRRVFDANGKISPQVFNGDRTLPQFAKAARAVANEEVVPFIDLNAISIEHHNALGPEASAAYNFNADDNTHFSPQGAKAIADLILMELKTAVPELARTLKR